MDIQETRFPHLIGPPDRGEGARAGPARVVGVYVFKAVAADVARLDPEVDAEGAAAAVGNRVKDDLAARVLSQSVC